MNEILLSTSDRVRDGLYDMLTAAIGDHGYGGNYVDFGLALMIIEIAKRAPDDVRWFPRGQWATINTIQARCELELRKLFPVVSV